MKASELMIGDWVLDGGVKAQVTSITCDGNIETTKRFSNEEVVEPISITEKILLDNGYERGTYAWRTFIKNLNDTQRMVINQFDRDDNVWLFKVVNPQDMSIENRILLYHVNQLQHAYKLLEIEEEIKL